MARRLLIANPSADVYGSDLQMLESVSAAVEHGWEVTVATPDDGPLVALLGERGATVRFVDYPVVRRSDMSIGGVFGLAGRALRALRTIVRVIRDERADVIYVNTVTIPWWPLAARLTRRPVVVHVHEAEEGDPLPIRFALNCPLWAASSLIVISQAALRATTGAVPLLRKRSNLIYNGVPQHATFTPMPDLGERPLRLVCVGRLTPRKGTDVAVEAVAELKARGHDVQLELGGTVFPGYEWYETQLRERAAQPDLAGCVTFSGYVKPVGPVLERAHVVLAPSLREPFGNVVVEAQLAERPVVAAAAMGHLETIQDGITGVLVEPGSPTALADGVERLIDDPALAAKIAIAGRQRSAVAYAPARYKTEVVAVLERLASRRRRNRVD